MSRASAALAPDRALCDTPEALLNWLRGRGLRISAARRVVVQALFAAARPVSADEIAAGLGGRLLALDPASVYRNLETLEELGCVQRLQVGSGAARYALRGPEDREFIACSACAALTEVEPGQLDRARTEIRSRFGFEPQFSRFAIVGLCPDCAVDT